MGNINGGVDIVFLSNRGGIGSFTNAHGVGSVFLVRGPGPRGGFPPVSLFVLGVTRRGRYPLTLVGNFIEANAAGSNGRGKTQLFARGGRVADRGQIKKLHCIAVSAGFQNWAERRAAFKLSLGDCNRPAGLRRAGRRHSRGAKEAARNSIPVGADGRCPWCRSY